jgi:hypothetical protein
MPTTEKTPATAAVFWRNDFGAVESLDAAGARVSVGVPGTTAVMVTTPPLPEVVRPGGMSVVGGAVTGGGKVELVDVDVDAVEDIDADVDNDDDGVTGVEVEVEMGGGTGLV